MTITQGNMSFILDEVTTAVAWEAAFRTPSVTSMLYFMRAATGRRERTSSVSDLDEFEVKVETASSAEDEMIQQFQKTFVHTPYAKHVKLSRELIDDEEWGLLGRLSTNFGSAFNQTVETLGAAPFNDAFNGVTYKSEDNKSICNNAHTNVDGGNSQDNSGTNSLNMAGVKATMIAQKKLTDYRGVKNAKVKTKLILHPVDLFEEAFEIAKSLTRPDTANRADNAYAGLDVMEWDELTDTNAWFAIDPDKMRENENLLWLWRRPLEMFGDGDLIKGIRRMGAYFRSSHGVVDWRWIYGNNPS